MAKEYKGRFEFEYDEHERIVPMEKVPANLNTLRFPLACIAHICDADISNIAGIVARKNLSIGSMVMMYAKESTPMDN